ncbi:MAG: hypothetical protein ABIH78_00665 [Candidatus Peregrinibacteria bacterium]
MESTGKGLTRRKLLSGMLAAAAIAASGAGCMINSNGKPATDAEQDFNVSPDSSDPGTDTVANTDNGPDSDLSSSIDECIGEPAEAITNEILLDIQQKVDAILADALRVLENSPEGETVEMESDDTGFNLKVIGPPVDDGYGDLQTLSAYRKEIGAVVHHLDITTQKQGAIEWKELSHECAASDSPVFVKSPVSGGLEVKTVPADEYFRLVEDTREQIMALMDRFMPRQADAL